MRVFQLQNGIAKWNFENERRSDRRKTDRRYLKEGHRHLMMRLEGLSDEEILIHMQSDNGTQTMINYSKEERQGSKDMS